MIFLGYLIFLSLLYDRGVPWGDKQKSRGRLRLPTASVGLMIYKSTAGSGANLSFLFVPPPPPIREKVFAHKAFPLKIYYLLLHPVKCCQHFFMRK
jgi:hypothetical protein